MSRVWKKKAGQIASLSLVIAIPNTFSSVIAQDLLSEQRWPTPFFGDAIQSASHTDLSGSPAFQPSSYVHTLEESAPASTLETAAAVVSETIEPSSNDGVVKPAFPKNAASSADKKTELIHLAPLTTPDTKVEGIGTGIHPEDVTMGRLPSPLMLPSGETRDGTWELYSKPWVPGGFCHQPLYFEDPMLERHGHEVCPWKQPWVSGVRFFGTLPLLPYLATLRHPLEEVHTLGSYRPGSPAPVLRYRPHYDPRAIRNELISAGVTAVAVP
jgi:hypothetical protein